MAGVEFVAGTSGDRVIDWGAESAAGTDTGDDGEPREDDTPDRLLKFVAERLWSSTIPLAPLSLIAFLPSLSHYRIPNRYSSSRGFFFVL
jgi:hypothetical protein